ncbi:MAG: GlsB/YeaQ/YmgE family stress response membrane protein [Acidobacteria bacterium]|nr:GlsB/YeaQ/YmgE family stress response membrane protein [Acidobacteriota bacterium]
MIIIGILGFGIMIGAIAEFITSGGISKDWGRTLVFGLGGSLVGGLVVSLLSGDGFALRPSGVIGSIVGAILLILGDRMVNRAE